MYETFYKLHPTPFRLTPDPHFFFESETHKRGLAYLRFAFYQREGFVVITGAPGTGKTELSLNLIEELPHNKVALARIVTTNLDADDFLDLVAESFKIDIKNVSKGSELKKLEEYFISQARMGKHVLLIIDEAHNLSVKSLLELSMLENFQLDEKPVMQCLLLGQLPLEDKLNSPELEPLKQRVIASTRLETLNQQETRDYVIHRLSKSGWNNNPIIHDEAFFFIHHYANGIPRKINLLCNRLLLHSYVESRHEIGPYTVNKVAEEIQEEGLGESLDIDFADMQLNIEFSSDPRQKKDQRPVLTNESDEKSAKDSVAENAKVSSEESVKENEAQQATLPNNKRANNKLSNDKPSHSIASDDIEIPDFIRKIPGQNSANQLRMLNEVKESESHESQWQQTGSTGHENFQSWEADTTQSDSSVATARHVTTQPVHRRSGLLDKDLQFLSSMAVSTALDTITAEPEVKPVTTPAATPATDPEPAPGFENEEEHDAEPVHKLIIDEPVYDENTPVETSDRHIIIDESALDDDEQIQLASEEDWRQPETKSPLKENWQLTAMAAAVVGSLVLSIAWLYDGNPDSATIVANNQVEIDTDKHILTEPEVFAAADPVDLNPVDVQLPNISPPVTTIEVEAIDETADETVDKTVSETTVSTKTISLPDAPDASNNAEPSKLDTQLTQILEQTTPAPVEPTNIATNEPPAIIEDNAPKPEKQNIAAVEKTMPPSAKEIASAADTKEEITPDSSLSVSPQEQTTAPAAAPVSPAAVASTPETETTKTTITMVNTRQESISKPPEVYISQADLTTLLSRLSNAYQTGNLQQLVTTFAADINSNEGSNRRQMLKEYQRLFNITDKRKLNIQDVKWSTKDKQVLGKGDFEVLIREKGATKYTTYQGKIHFAVTKEANNIVIKKLDYDYGQ